jgi:hypothetical protein
LKIAAHGVFVGVSTRKILLLLQPEKLISAMDKIDDIIAKVRAYKALMSNIIFSFNFIQQNICCTFAPTYQLPTELSFF